MDDQNKKLKYKKINHENIKVAAQIQYQIFPYASAYYQYRESLNNSDDLPINFLVYYDDFPIGIIGLYEIKEYSDTIWLSWFGLLEKYRHKGFGTQMFQDILIIAKQYHKKFLRLYTYEIWNQEAQPFYQKIMEIGEYYQNPEDDQYDIIEGKCKIFGYSLCNEPIDYWNDRFIDIKSEDDDHEKSILLMKRDGIL